MTHFSFFSRPWAENGLWMVSTKKSCNAKFILSFLWLVFRTLILVKKKLSLVALFIHSYIHGNGFFEAYEILMKFFLL